MSRMNAKSKYRAKPTVVDGIRFASMKEAARFRELKLLEKAGEIEALELQPAFELTVQGVKLGRYVGDFRYVERGDLFHKGDGLARVTVVEDVKGMKTPMYRWKRKHVLAEHGVDIREV